MSKEEIIKRLFECKTDQDFMEMDDQIMKIKKSGDVEAFQYLWNQLYMIEEGVVRLQYQNKN